MFKFSFVEKTRSFCPPSSSVFFHLGTVVVVVVVCVVAFLLFEVSFAAATLRLGLSIYSGSDTDFLVWFTDSVPEGRGAVSKM